MRTQHPLAFEAITRIRAVPLLLSGVVFRQLSCIHSLMSHVSHVRLLPAADPLTAVVIACCCCPQPNQLPIDDLHIDFNERLWSLTQRIFMKDGWYQQNKTIEGADFQYERSSTDQHEGPGAGSKASLPPPKDLMGKLKRK